jgi:HSP20 family protein
LSSEGDNNIEPFDWFRRFFGSNSSGSRASRQYPFGDMFRGFDEMRSQMKRQFEEQLKNFQSTAPKELVREYETPEGDKVREVGPIVYGYSMTVGPDGKPKIREFGNVRSSPLRGSAGGGSSFSTPLISSERQPLADVITTDTEVKVVVEMPGANKENIKVNAYDSSVEITATGQEERKYREIVEIPPETDIETAKSIYKNGILDITFKKKEQTKPKGKQINVE